jgi:hypothetical protein
MKAEIEDTKGQRCEEERLKAVDIPTSLMGEGVTLSSHFLRDDFPVDTFESARVDDSQ